MVPLGRSPTHGWKFPLRYAIRSLCHPSNHAGMNTLIKTGPNSFLTTLRNFLTSSVCTIYLDHRHTVVPYHTLFICTWLPPNISPHALFPYQKPHPTFGIPCPLKRGKTGMPLCFPNCLFSSVAFWALAEKHYWRSPVWTGSASEQCGVQTSSDIYESTTVAKARLGGCVYLASFSSFSAVYCFNLLGAPKQQGWMLRGGFLIFEGYA